jgi:hypothetical protein
MPQFDNAKLTDTDSEIAHEDALVFDLVPGGENGLTIGWKPSGLALKRAKSDGVEAGEILDTLRGNADPQVVQDILSDLDTDDLTDLDEEDISDLDEEQREALGDLLGSGLSDQIDMIATLVWIGTLHFEPNAKRETILSILDPQSVEELPVDRMFERIFPVLSEIDDPADTAEDGEGK